VRIIHLGSPIDLAAREALALSLASELGQPITATTVAVPAAAISRTDDDLGFMRALTRLLHVVADVPALSLCIEEPVNAPRAQRLAKREQQLTKAVDELLGSHPLVTRTPGDQWRVRVARGPCAAATQQQANPADAGSKPNTSASAGGNP
jgi:hypothetical protein